MPESANFNAAIACLGKGQQWLWALGVLADMPLARVGYTDISFGAAISGLLQKGGGGLPTAQESEVWSPHMFIE